jgi:V8-like Glu-specific endopeptidase
VAIAALLQVTTLLGTAQAAEMPRLETVPVASGQVLQDVAAQRTPAGRGHEDEHHEDRDARNDDPLLGVLRSVGQLTSSFGTCTATVIDDESQRLALTAAHCVISRNGKSAKNIKFVPALTGTKQPYGTWKVENFWYDPGWIDTGERRYDVAVLRIAPQVNENDETIHIQEVVGGQQYDLRGADQDDVAVGYPKGEVPNSERRFDGKTQERCKTDEIEADEDSLYTTRCRMTGGSSGGSWIRSLNAKTGAGTIVAVTSAGNKEATHLKGVALQEYVRDLIELARRNGD